MKRFIKIISFLALLSLAGLFYCRYQAQNILDSLSVNRTYTNQWSFVLLPEYERRLTGLINPHLNLDNIKFVDQFSWIKLSYQSARLFIRPWDKQYINLQLSQPRLSSDVKARRASLQLDVQKNQLSKITLDDVEFNTTYGKFDIDRVLLTFDTDKLYLHGFVLEVVGIKHAAGLNAQGLEFKYGYVIKDAKQHAQWYLNLKIQNKKALITAVTVNDENQPINLLQWLKPTQAMLAKIPLKHLVIQWDGTDKIAPVEILQFYNAEADIKTNLDQLQQLFQQVKTALISASVAQ